MSDKAKITLGLGAFLVLATFPVWNRLFAAGDAAKPELELPADASQCVEATEYMTANHMDLLNQWRDAVVREGRREHTSSLTGETYEMSLTGTCLGCHTSRDAFCTRCHDYANVEPTCWDCHLEPRLEPHREPSGS
ncbi:MAG: sulfate reduction electron transfer complex DsrMKJOP subunit DsrJ [Planctomycetota bacterium]|jgi:hypothetical protein